MVGDIHHEGGDFIMIGAFYYGRGIFTVAGGRPPW